MKPIRLGLALGSGSARGWSHIGVLQGLEAEGIRPEIVAGTSIGAFVGATYAQNALPGLESWVRSLSRQDVLGLLDVSFRSGFIKGRKLMDAFETRFATHSRFDALPKQFAAVATDLLTGREVWLREGNVAAAVRASIAMPGLFAPVEHDGQLLVDGALVNPVPVSLCRAMGADVVIAVDLGSDTLGRPLRRDEEEGAGDETLDVEPAWKTKLREWIRFPAAVRPAEERRDSDLPSLLAVVENSINIMQVRISRSRLAGEPADVLIAPRLGHLGLLDYHRAEEAIAEGRAAVQRTLPVLHHTLGH